MVCRDVEVQPVLQDTSGEDLNRGSNKAQDAKLDIHALGFWERHRSAFFDVRVCHPNAVSFKDLKRQQIYRIHENEKKRLYSRRVLDIEHGIFTPLVFTTTGGMGKECLMYHSRLAQLIAIKKGSSMPNYLIDLQTPGCVCEDATSRNTYYNLHLPYSGPNFHADPSDFRRSNLSSVEGFCILWLQYLDWSSRQ